ncbi:MAG: class I SAM-dependent RNA methyltransferase [Bryobacteraceae bacterium]
MRTPETNNPPSGEARITAEKWVYGGDALARIDGQVVLAPFLLPGEEAQIRVERAKPGLLSGRVIRIEQPSPHRIEPGCPYFGRCGGCQYQHAPYAYQLEQKRAILAEVLRRVGKFEPPEEIGVVSGPEWGYRNRVQLHLAGGELGYLEAGSHRLCPIERCPISSPRINEAIAALRRMQQDRRFPGFVRSIELFTNEATTLVNVLESERPIARWFFDWCAESIPGAGAGQLDYETGGVSYRVSHRSFFQVNRFLVESLIETALEGAEGETALDLYAGVGLFTIPLARRFRSVSAVETGASAVRDLELNLDRAGVRAESWRGAADAFLRARTEAPDFVLADPPRAGLGKSAVRELLRLRPRRLTIVSCDAATLARDVAALLGGGYRLDAMTIVDLFPQTAHIETVARLGAVT